MELAEMSAGKLPSFLQGLYGLRYTQVLDVNMTLYGMLAGLAKGQQCSELAYNFLTLGGGKVTVDRFVRCRAIDILVHDLHSARLLANQPPQLSGDITASLPTSSTHSIRPKDVLLAQAFLRLLSTVGSSSVAVRLAISPNTQFRAIPSLVSLVPLGIPLQLLGAIFDTLAAFCEPEAGVTGVDVLKSAWLLMERVEVINVRASVSARSINRGAVLPPVKGAELELNEVRAVYKPYLATIPF
jgi:nuclear pore complex protein Nup205